MREMILYSIRSETKPVKRFQNRSDVIEFWSLDNSSRKSILGVLDTIYLKFRKPIRRVIVVKFGVYNGGGNCFCGVKVKVGTDTADCGHLTVEASTLMINSVIIMCLL